MKFSHKNAFRPARLQAVVVAKLCLVGLCALMVAACATRGGTQAARAQLDASPSLESAAAYSDAYLTDFFRSKKLTGMAVTVVSPDRELYTAAWGKATPNQPFTTDTLTGVASISKLFTATAIMHLVEAGLVDLDAPLSRYLPDFRPKTWGPDPDGVTIRAILAHQSGLISDYYGPGFMPLPSWKDQVDRPYADLATLVSDTTLCNPPYTIHSYSNVGFALLGLVVEAASGMRFSDYVQQHILLPAGMVDSGFLYRPELERRYARGRKGTQWVDLMGIPDTPAGSMTSSARELGLFMQAVLKTRAMGIDSSAGGILRPDTLDRMWTQENRDTELDFGAVQLLAWYATETQDGTDRYYYGHGGDLPGFHALLMVDPERHIGVALMVNSDAVDSTGLIAAVRELLQLWSATAPDSASPSDFTVTEAAPSAIKPRSGKPDSGQEAFLGGNWASPVGLFRVSRTGPGLFLDFMGIPLELLAVGPDSYIAKAKLLYFIPVSHPLIDQLTIHAKTLDGRRFLSIDVGGTHGLILERLEPAGLPESWLARLGSWRLMEKPEGDFLNLNPDRLLLYQDKASGLYCLKVWRDGSAMSFPVASRSADTIYLRGYGRGLGETLTVETSDGKEIISWLGSKFIRD